MSLEENIFMARVAEQAERGVVSSTPSVGARVGNQHRAEASLEKAKGGVLGAAREEETDACAQRAEEALGD